MLAVTWLTACSDNGGDVIPPAVEEPEQEEPDAPESEESTHHFLMGSLFSFQKNLRNGVDAANGGTASTTFYNKPLFEAKTFAATDEEWWDNLVEEFVYSGLDYVAANCRGRLPRADENPKYELDHGDPTRIKDLIAALKRRDVKDLKIAIFDDCPASWAAARNYDLYGKYSTVLSSSEQQSLKLSDEEVVYPLDDLEAIYKYIWDYNIKLAFQNFYGENAANNDYLFRYNGKPVLYLWSINGFLNVEYAALGGKRISCTGKLKNILEKIREDFKATFGEDLFLCVDKAFFDRDSRVTKSVVDARNDWFIASEQATNRSSYSLYTLNGTSVGVAVPGFLTNDKSGSRMLFDANHGKTLTTALDHMVKNKADLLLLEGFTDMAENAAFWRSTDETYYDFPNQRLNILRKYNATKAYPAELRVEAETCDRAVDKSEGNSGRQYRKGDLDIKKCNDTFGGWCVTDTEAGESLTWVELPFRSGKSLLKLRYASQEEAEVCFAVDGEKCAGVKLPATDGAWKEQEVAAVHFDRKAWHEVTLHFLSGRMEVNCFNICAVSE